jgi:hypothetical protein
MQAYEGYFTTNDRFVPNSAVPMPVGKRVIVTILDEPAQTPQRDDKAFWAEFDRLAAASSDEVLRDEDFPRTNSSRELEREKLIDNRARNLAGLCNQSRPSCSLFFVLCYLFSKG